MHKIITILLIIFASVIFKSNSLSINSNNKIFRKSKLQSTANANIDASKLSKIGVVLLAGGKGKRMKSVVPKQFLPILGRPVFLRSLDIFTKSMSALFLKKYI